MTFVNEDPDTREIAFGQHPEHGIYAGLTEVPFHGKITKTITLSEIGSYKFHDHLHEETAGDFRVTE